MYKFHLESLLNHRKFLEESIQRDLALAKRQLGLEEGEMERLVRMEHQVAFDLKQKQQAMMNAHEFLLCQTFLERLSKEINQQHQKVCEAQFKVDATRNDLIEAVKKRETLEKLKESGLEAYTRKLLKNEQDCLNETAVIRFYHNQLENQK
jgi:flagellar FliJ protein